LFSESASLAVAQYLENSVTTFETEIQAEADLVSWYNDSGELETIRKKGFVDFDDTELVYTVGDWETPPTGSWYRKVYTGKAIAMMIGSKDIEVNYDGKFYIEDYPIATVNSAPAVNYIRLGTWTGSAPVQAEITKKCLINIGPPGLITVSSVVVFKSPT
jgi:hypothetical protein